MDSQLLTGKLVRLIAADPDQCGKLSAQWSRDSEFLQLFDSDPVLPCDQKRAQERFRERAEKGDPQRFDFLIQRLEDDRVIGECGLSHVLSPHRNGWLFIGIGERELWGKGYGGDALTILLRFGFVELNLYRVNLGTFEFNPRAVRAYERAGFVVEGRERQAMRRYGRRWDVIPMGILRSEWEKQEAADD